MVPINFIWQAWCIHSDTQGAIFTLWWPLRSHSSSQRGSLGSGGEFYLISGGFGNHIMKAVWPFEHIFQLGFMLFLLTIARLKFGHLGLENKNLV